MSKFIYKSRNDLKNKNSSLYRRMLKEHSNLLDLYFEKTDRTFWTKETCIQSARMYRTFTEWYNDCERATVYARKTNILDECRSHMESNGFIFWTDKLALANAKQFKTKMEWLKSPKNSHQFARKNLKLFQICTKHMDSEYGKWNNFDECFKVAKKFKTRALFGKKFRSAYKSILKNKWGEQCFAHMTFLQRPWTNKEIIADAKKFKSIKEWEKKSSAPQIARKRKIMHLCTKHMVNMQMKYIKNLDTNRVFKSQVIAAKVYNINNPWGIGCSIKKGLKTGGYRWAYCDENGKVI